MSTGPVRRSRQVAAKTSSRGRRIALFGGTFDPIHAGHIAVAQEAVRRLHLDCVYFIPAGRPPHKHISKLTPYAHRFAMVTLACAGHGRFVPSLAEAESGIAGRRIFYSVDTVRQFRKRFSAPGDDLYFIVGADAFLLLDSWKDPERLLGLCNFVVASRPGFRCQALRQVIPAKLLAPQPEENTRKPRNGEPNVIALRNSSVYLLGKVASRVSATDVRQRLDRGQSIHGLVPSSVEEYIKKQALYR